MTIPRQCQVFRAINLNLPQIAHVETTNSATKGVRMQHVPHHDLARGSHVTVGIAIAALFYAASGLISPANAQLFGSSYTSTAPGDCRVSGARNGVDDSATRVCPGKAGLVVLVSEDDLRETVSVGRNGAAAAREPAAEAWFGPFSSTTTTVEWRTLDGKPFAIIQRWHLADNSDEDKDGRPVAKAMLAVTRLPPGAVCHVAYIDVKANPNANELARKTADEIARDFKCGKDEVKVIGVSGRAVELATRR
jgi:hypothetical protein